MQVLSFDVSMRIPKTHEGRSTQNQRCINKPQQCGSARCGHCGRQCGRFYTNVIVDCPAYGSTCRGCGRTNHLIKICMAGAKDTRTRRPTRPVMSEKQGIHALENSKDTDNQSELYFDQLEIKTLWTVCNTGGTQALVQLKIQVSTVHEPDHLQARHRCRRKRHNAYYL